MIFSCNDIDLKEALSDISAALPVHKLSPILEGIKIEAEGDIVKLTATNMDFTIIKIIKGDVKMSGEVLVPGSLFIEFIKKLNKDSDVIISDEESYVVIECLDNKTTINKLDIQEYPVVKDYEYKEKVSILKSEFKDLINKTSFACNVTDDNKPVLKGCLLKVEDNTIQSVALDGFRMAICKKELDKSYPAIEMNITAKDLNSIVKLLENDDEKIELCFSDKKLIIEENGLKIISTPIEGRFMNYQSTMPKSFETEITVNKKILESCVDRVGILSRFEKTNLIKLEVKSNILNISSTSEIGNAQENINVLTKGKDTLVGYNSNYIAECLKHIDDEYIVLKMNYTAPSIITGVENSEYNFLILPVRFR